MDIFELVSRFAVALGVGLLIGLERGWRTRAEASGSRTAGIRTFALSSLLGGVVGAIGATLGGTASGILIGVATAGYVFLIVIFCLEENRADKTFSATTAVAATVAFTLGLYALLGNLTIAAALAVIAATILALRELIHGLVKKITWPELRSGLVLLAMTFVALPIVPDNSIGPYGGINPREVWLIAIILASISFLGYVAVKYLGPTHGVLLAATAGGIVSSTAVTIDNARRAATHEGATHLLAAGVAAASVVMFLRVCFIVLALNPALAPLILPPIIAAAVTALGFALVPVLSDRSRPKEHHQIKLRNPFNFWTVVAFALVLGGLILVGRVVAELVGPAGTIVGAAVVGLADVDAITVSITRLAPQPLSTSTAALAILAAVSADTISKIGIGSVIGPGSFARRIAVMAVACHAAGALALLALI